MQINKSILAASLFLLTACGNDGTSDALASSESNVSHTEVCMVGRAAFDGDALLEDMKKTLPQNLVESPDVVRFAEVLHARRLTVEGRRRTNLETSSSFGVAQAVTAAGTKRTFYYFDDDAPSYASNSQAPHRLYAAMNVAPQSVTPGEIRKVSVDGLFQCSELSDGSKSSAVCKFWDPSSARSYVQTTDSALCGAER